MGLYKIEKGEVTRLKETPFKKEKDLQNLIEDNLDEIFSLVFIKSEFSVGNFRLDTVAYNKETNSFVIIEYKKSKSDSVIDQGYTYLNLLLEHKAAFVLTYNEKFPKDIKTVNSFDWSQTRVLFISRYFTEYQKGAASNPNLPIDLILVKNYSNSFLDIEQITKSAYGHIINNNEVSKISDSLSKEIKVYSEEDHLGKISDEMLSLYKEIKESILSWDSDINIKATKVYISFRSKKNIVDILPQKNQLKIWINLKKGMLEDSKSTARDVSKTGHWGNGDYEIVMKDSEDFEYILSLIKQSWKYYRNQN